MLPSIPTLSMSRRRGQQGYRPEGVRVAAACRRAVDRAHFRRARAARATALIVDDARRSRSDTIIAHLVAKDRRQLTTR